MSRTLTHAGTQALLKVEKEVSMASFSASSYACHWNESAIMYFQGACMLRLVRLATETYTCSQCCSIVDEAWQLQ